MTKPLSFVFILGFFSFLVMPFFYTGAAMDPTLHSGFVIWSFLTLGLSVHLLTKKEMQPLLAELVCRKIFWVGGIFLLTATFSLMGAINMGEGVFAWFGIILTGSFFFICTLFFCRYPHHFVFLCRWAVAAGFGLVLLGLAGRYWQNDSALFKSFFFKGIMINKNIYATSLFLLIPFVVHTLISERNLWQKAAIILLPALCSVSLFSLSRAVWLAMTLAGVPVMILAYRCSLNCRQRGKAAHKFFKIGVFSALLIVSLIGACLFLPPSPEKNQTALLRLALWESTVKMIRDNMFLGVGPGQWRLVLPKYEEPQVPSAENIEIHAQRPHNDFLWVAAETGLPGLSCYLIFFSMLYYYIAKIIEKADLEQSALALSMLYGISGYLIIAMFSYPRERPLHSLFIMLMAASVVSSYHPLYPVTLSQSSCRAGVGILKYGILVLLAVCCLNSALRLYSEIQLKRALKARAAGEWQQVIFHIDKAIWSVYAIDPFGVPLPWYRGMAHYQLNNLPAALDDFNRAVSYHPYHVHSLNNQSIMEKAIRNQSHP